MLNIRGLSLDEIAMVSSGNANSNDERGGSQSRSRNASGSCRSCEKDIYSGVDSCGAGILAGLVGGSINQCRW